MNKVLVSTVLATVLASNSYAKNFEKSDVDPADLTKVSSSVILGMSNQNDVKIQGSLAGTYDSGNGYMLLGETSMNEQGDYKNSRLQYFHSFNTPSKHIPKASGLLDIIDNEVLTSAAIGTTLLVMSPWENVMFFPQAAYVHGELKSDFSQPFGNINTSVSGGLAALYTSIRLDSQGSFINFSPEITQLSGDVELLTTKFIVNFGTPLSIDRDKWVMFKIENIQNQVTVDGDRQSETNNTVAWMSFRMFF